MTSYPMLTPEVVDLLALAGYTALKSEATFRRGLRANARGLYERHLTRLQFYGGMRATLARGFQQAANEALRDCGKPPNSLTREAQAHLQTELLRQDQWLTGLTDFIERAAANKDPIDGVLARMELWVPLYLRAKNLARLYACPEANSQWLYGDTLDHCWHALTYHERVYPNHVWLDTLGPVEALPQGRGLQCRGYRCACRLVPTDLPSLPGVPPTVVTADVGYLAKAAVKGLCWTLTQEGAYYAREGKSVWPTADQALAHLATLDPGRWQVGVVLADWSRDTVEVPGQAFRALALAEMIIPVTEVRVDQTNLDLHEQQA